MRAIIASAVVLGLAQVSPSTAWGQAGGATTVQLPTFRFFTVQTAVSVPDSGGAYLGGLSSGASSSSRRGIPLMIKDPWIAPLMGSRGMSHSTATSGASVHATIIDHEELDRAVLADAASRSSPPSETDAKAGELSRQTGPGHGDAAPLESVAEIRRQQAAQEQAQADKASELYAKAQALERDGQTGQAKIFYRQAARHASAEMKQQIAARLAALK